MIFTNQISKIDQKLHSCNRNRHGRYRKHANLDIKFAIRPFVAEREEEMEVIAELPGE